MGRNDYQVWMVAMMPNNGENNSFSFGDALFLYVEREGQPLNIAGVSVFEGDMKLKDCMAFIESKLPLIPRYRQRVVFPPFDLGLPRWEFDRNFDIRNHVHQVKLKHGTEQELKALAGTIVSARLDRGRPLWDFTLARLQGGRTGLITRIHHCLADGIAGVGAMNVIMDTSPVPVPLARKKSKVEPPAPQQDPAANLLNGLAKSYLSLVNGALTLQTGLLNVAQEAVANPTGPPAEMVRLMSELAAPAERLPFNTVCRGPQKFAWTEVSLADIKAVKNNWGGTVNDVILAIVTLAFGRYAEQRGVDLKGRSLRIVIPVNVRGNGSATELGNKISFVPVPGASGHPRSAEAAGRGARTGGTPQARARCRICGLVWRSVVIASERFLGQRWTGCEPASAQPVQHHLHQRARPAGAALPHGPQDAVVVSLGADRWPDGHQLRHPHL